MGLDATLIRKRPLSALIVGATGMNVLKVVSAFEGRRIGTVRVDDVAAANERIPRDMPHAVLVLIPTSASEQEEISERALAVGAVVAHASATDPALSDILDRLIVKALQNKLAREQVDLPSSNKVETDTAPPPPASIDEGWDE